MEMPNEADVRAACEMIGLNPDLLLSAMTADPPTSEAAQGAAPVHRMGHRIAPISRTYTPLSADELDVLSTIFVVGRQARVSGSVILNAWVERATTGRTIESAPEPMAIYMRWRRSCRRHEVAALRDLVASRPDVFSADRLRAFEVLAFRESQYRKSNGWDRH